MSNQLARATILDTSTGESVSVMYNPEEMKLDQGNSFAEVGIPGLDASPLQYVRGKTRTLSMELFFDTYETGQDVRAHTARIVRLLDKRADTHAPPVLVFVLGSFTFRCVLVDAGQRFTHFRPDGRPVRSYLSVRLQEYVEVSVQIERGLFLGSPTVAGATRQAVDLARDVAAGNARVHVVGVGETLQGVSAVLLGDPKRWRELAELNDVADPFDLAPGSRLVVPGRG
ncbi:CIS tube protein [Nocardia aurea]|uniref:LysM domain-containing protein n=1 Tax=Nocardia aurea TaxID=2144174 RepID=A0ABV3G1M4_9NOCA